MTHTTLDEEIQLITKSLSGDSGAYEALAKDGVRLSVAIASKYEGELNILVPIAFNAWTKALPIYLDNKRYNDGDKFSTYAVYFMKTAVEDFLNK